MHTVLREEFEQSQDCQRDGYSKKHSSTGGSGIINLVFNSDDGLEAYLAYSSSPNAFAQAWKFRKTKISKLSLFEVQELLSRHAQLIPTIRSENLLNCGEKGMIKSTKNPSFLMGIRHSKGNYDDNLDNLGHFNYQPPADPLGMLRYRWLEVLAVKFNLPIYMFVTMWFKYEAIKSTNHVTLICPVKITSRNKKFDSPLNLQLIDVHEGIERAMMIRSLDELEIQTSVRSALNDEIVICSWKIMDQNYFVQSCSFGITRASRIE